MKLVFTKSNLNKAVGIVMKAVPTRTTMNILECILIDATTNEIKFTGNDMELGIETIVEGEIIEKGKIAIDAKLFSEIVRKLPDNDITLTTDSNIRADDMVLTMAESCVLLPAPTTILPSGRWYSPIRLSCISE